MNSDRIKQLQEETAYPESLSVYKALLQVWNECEQEHNKQLRIANVVKSFTAKEVADMLVKNFATIEEAIHYFDNLK